MKDKVYHHIVPIMKLLKLLGNHYDKRREVRISCGGFLYHLGQRQTGKPNNTDYETGRRFLSKKSSYGEGRYLV